MRIAFFSDIHGNKYVVNPFLESIKAEKVDKIIFCGDIFGYYYYQNEIIDMFRQQKFVVLLGNHDKNFLDIIEKRSNAQEFVEKYGNSYADIVKRISKENIAFLRTLKPYYEFQVGLFKIGVFHGSPYDNLCGRVYPDTEIIEKERYIKYDLVVLGHTHHKMVRYMENTLIINPGSIGQQRDGSGCSYVLFDTQDYSVRFNIVDYNIGLLISDIETLDRNNCKLKEVLLRKH